jgi:hypothetical protein
MATIERTALYGISAEFESGEELLEAVKKTKAEGYRIIEAYSPYEVEGMSQALNRKSPRMPWFVLGGLLLGAFTGFSIQYVTDAVYALNLGGRPYIAWQSYGVLTYEFGILGAGLTTFALFLRKTGLPLPYHPIFNTQGFEKASSSHFYLCVRTTDPKFNIDRTTEFLGTLGANNVSEVRS